MALLHPRKKGLPPGQSAAVGATRLPPPPRARNKLHNLRCARAFRNLSRPRARTYLRAEVHNEAGAARGKKLSPEAGRPPPEFVKKSLGPVRARIMPGAPSALPPARPGPDLRAAAARQCARAPAFVKEALPRPPIAGDRAAREPRAARQIAPGAHAPRPIECNEPRARGARAAGRRDGRFRRNRHRPLLTGVERERGGGRERRGGLLAGVRGGAGSTEREIGTL